MMQIGYVDNEVCPDCGEWMLVVVTDDGVGRARHTCDEVAVKMRGLLRKYGTDDTIHIEGEYG